MHDKEFQNKIYCYVKYSWKIVKKWKLLLCQAFENADFENKCQKQAKQVQKNYFHKMSLIVIINFLYLREMKVWEVHRKLKSNSNFTWLLQYLVEWITLCKCECHIFIFIWQGSIKTETFGNYLLKLLHMYSPCFSLYVMYMLKWYSQPEVNYSSTFMPQNKVRTN